MSGNEYFNLYRLNSTTIGHSVLTAHPCGQKQIAKYLSVQKMFLKETEKIKTKCYKCEGRYLYFLEFMAFEIN
jgi:hypothetical protein